MTWQAVVMWGILIAAGCFLFWCSCRYPKPQVTLEYGREKYVAGSAEDIETLVALMSPDPASANAPSTKAAELAGGKQ